MSSRNSAPDVVELAEEVAAADVPDVLDEELAGGAQPDDVADVVQPLLVDHPGRVEVVADLGLGQRDDRPVLEARPEDEGDDPAAEDDGQEAEDELLAQGTVMKPTARILADRHSFLEEVPNISPEFGDSQLSFRGTWHSIFRPPILSLTGRIFFIIIHPDGVERKRGEHSCIEKRLLDAFWA